MLTNSVLELKTQRIVTQPKLLSKQSICFFFNIVKFDAWARLCDSFYFSIHLNWILILENNSFRFESNMLNQTNHIKNTFHLKNIVINSKSKYSACIVLSVTKNSVKNHHMNIIKWLILNNNSWGKSVCMWEIYWIKSVGWWMVVMKFIN